MSRLQTFRLVESTLATKVTSIGRRDIYLLQLRAASKIGANLIGKVIAGTLG